MGKSFIDNKNVQVVSDVANLEAKRIINSFKKIIPITRPTATRHLIVLCAEHLTSKKNTLQQMKVQLNIITQDDYDFLLGQHFYFYAGIILSLNVGVDDYDRNPNSQKVACILGDILCDEVMSLEKSLYNISDIKDE